MIANDNNRPRWREVVLFVSMVSLFIAMLILVLPDALEREAAFNEGIRDARCARMGDNIPENMIGYCTEKGV